MICIFMLCISRIYIEFKKGYGYAIIPDEEAFGGGMRERTPLLSARNGKLSEGYCAISRKDFVEEVEEREGV